MAAESGSAPAQGGHSVPIVNLNKGAQPKPVSDGIDFSKRSVTDQEFLDDIPPDELLDAVSLDGDPEERPRKSRPKPEREPEQPKPKKRKPEPEPEPEEDDDEELAASAEDEPEPEQPEPEETDEEPATKAWSVPDGKGGKDAPLSLKELPEELFVELSVNGEKVTVDLKEAARGYMRRQAFDQQTSKVKQGLTDAHEIAEKAVSAQEQMKQRLDATRAGFSDFIRDPKRVLAALFENVQDKRRIFDALIEDHEDDFEGLAVSYVDLIQRENGLQKDGYQSARQRRARDREQRRYQRQQDDLARREQQIVESKRAWEAEQAERKRRAEAEQQETAAAQAAFNRLKPGIDAGLLALGLKDMTPELSEELKVRLKVTSELKKGAPLTAEDVKQAILRAAKAIDLKPATPGKPAPAPGGGSAPRRAAPTPSGKPNGSNGAGKFDSMPHDRRVRDLEWYLNG